MIDEALFRHAMSQFASGVTVVTTAFEGRLGGLTVSSFASLSLNPPLVLVCIDHSANSHDLIAESGLFAVNILGEGQEHLSRRFAERDSEKFLPGAFTLSAAGLPLITGALAQIECRVHNSLPGGDHTIYVGEVVNAQIGAGRPLLYFRSSYYALGE
ncbi:MAG: flavin reductase family protein [Oscillochloris sp.]|nr:flavin reductase family protein [Oscillochloris sp.]